MELIADLHIHSKYSRATSPQCDLEGLSEWARIKGIGLLGTGDFTHPKWRKELKQRLKPAEDGLFMHNEIRYMLQAEVSNIFRRGEKLKKLHTILYSPSFEVAEQVSDAIGKHGNLAEDGRPILTMDVMEMLDTLFSLSDELVVVPAHAWTPWFGVFGSKSGFDSLKEALGKHAKRIFAIETGLSSDPAMNWMLSELDDVSLISNSDAHSPPKLGREANVFSLPELSYKALMDAIRTRKGFVKTYEFYPEEGKYHWDGHRNCGIFMSPREAMRHRDICPKCRKPLTVGVLHRVVALADRREGEKPEGAVPYTSLVPLATVISAVRGRGEQAKGVKDEYFKLVNYFGTEFAALEAPESELALASDAELARGVVAAREGKVHWRPGYDGVFGELSFSAQAPQQDKSQTALTDF